MARAGICKADKIRQTVESVYCLKATIPKPLRVSKLQVLVQPHAERVPMMLIAQIEYQALSDWYVSLPDGSHVVYFEWSQVVPPVTHFAFYVDGELAYKGFQELLIATIFGKDSDRFEWNGHHFVREGKTLTVDGVAGSDTSHLGGVKTAWYLALEDGVHIVQFSRRAALATAIGGAAVGLLGKAIGIAVDWMLSPTDRALPSTRVWYDGLLLHRQTGVLSGTEVCRFTRGAHVFVVEWERNADPVLVVDGTRLKPADLVKGSALRPGYVFVREVVTSQDVEILGIENYPLDNLRGTETLAYEQAFEKTISGEVTFLTQLEGNMELGVDLAQLIPVLKADVSAKLSRQTGQKIGETLVRRQTVTMRASPKTFVMYTLTWKRTVRKGTWVIRVNGRDIALPYVAYLDLTAELKSYDAL